MRRNIGTVRRVSRFNAPNQPRPQGAYRSVAAKPARLPFMVTRELMSRQRLTAVLSCVALATGVAWLTADAAGVRRDRPAAVQVGGPTPATEPGSLDELFVTRWAEADVTPAPPADELTVLRRLALALMGTVPSLEEIRLFEADGGTDRLARWTDRLLADRRFADYWAERLARPLVGGWSRTT